MLAYLGARLSPSGAYVGPSGGYVGPMLGVLYAIYVDVLLRCDFSIPNRFSQAQATQKPRFFNFAKMQSMAAEGPETL